MGKAVETAGDNALEIWPWQENREMGQQLQGEGGIKARLSFGFGVFCSCVLLYFFLMGDAGAGLYAWISSIFVSVCL